MPKFIYNLCTFHTFTVYIPQSSVSYNGKCALAGPRSKTTRLFINLRPEEKEWSIAAVFKKE